MAPFLTSGLDGIDCSSLFPGRFSQGTAPGSHWIRGWVGPTFDLDAMEKRKILHFQKPNPGPPAHSPRYTELSWFFALYYILMVLVNDVIKQITQV
jgi:hypothetical protein